MKELLEECKKGNHTLKDIFKSTWDIDHVVRWCEICGSVVVDCDFDGRTNAGQIMRMKYSVLFREVLK